MKRIMINRRVVVAAVILGCFLAWSVQFAVAENAKEDKTKVPEKTLAQKVIDQWQGTFPKQPYGCWQKKSPWAGLYQFQAPPVGYGVKELKSISLDMGRNEYESTSFVLTNLSDKPMEFEITSASSSPKGISTTLRKGVWMTAKDGAEVNDALSLIDGGKIVIPSGDSREIWITLHTDNASPGKYKQTINVSPKGFKARTVDIAVTVHNVSLPKVLPLYTFFWDYVVIPQATPEMIKAKLTDLKNHYVNTATVHPWNLPRFAFDKKGKLITDYTLFDKTVDTYEAGLAPETYFFEMLCDIYFEPSNKPGYPGAENRPKFLSPEWKAGFRKWLKGWVAHMKSRGMGYDKYFLHPYDEQLGDNVRTVCQLIKEIDPKLRLIANSLSSPKGIEKIGPYVDAWMPYFYYYWGGHPNGASQTSINAMLKQVFPGPEGTSVPTKTDQRRLLGAKSGKLFWTYANPCPTITSIPPAKADPYQRYRMGSWHAWNEGMTGFGYWIYCHREAWNYLGSREGGYAVVYRSNAKDCPPEVSKKELIVTGKRWEATREGLEDYSYLYLLEQAIAKASPEEAAKAKKLLAAWPEKILENWNNPRLAEKAKKQIMEEIVKLKQ